MSSKISALTAASALDLTEKYPIVQGGSTKGATGAQLQTALAATAAQAKDMTHTAHLLTPANLLDLAVNRLLFILTAANMNSTGDQQFTKIGTFTNWTAQTVRAVSDAGSVSFTTAVGGIYRNTGKANALVGNTQVYTSISGSNNNTGQGVALNGAYGGGIITETPYLSLTTPQGTASTATFYIFGYALS